MELQYVEEREPHPHINPYRASMGIALNRLRWDLNVKSWVSRKKINRLHNQYLGQKAVIICNGPSLRKVDFSALRKTNVYTFGMNKINLLFEESSFRPACIIAMNMLVIDQNRQFYNETSIPLFLNSAAHKIIRFRENVHFLHDSYLPRKFARNCAISITPGHTVTYAAMQLAFHMGFHQVALVGCDHDFEVTGIPNATIVSSTADRDHFHPDYFGKDAAWQLPDFRGMETHFQLARDTYARYDRSIVNCTEGGKLEVFERKDLSDFLKES